MTAKLSGYCLPDYSLDYFFKKLGADEILTNNYTPNNGATVREITVRFGKRYMKLPLDYWTMQSIVFGPSSIFKELESEVQDFLLTGKNEIFPEKL